MSIISSSAEPQHRHSCSQASRNSLVTCYRCPPALESVASIERTQFHGQQTLAVAMASSVDMALLDMQRVGIQQAKLLETVVAWLR